MESITLTPAGMKGRIVVPPSKSLAHRMIICAALADGISRVSPIQASEDILATMDGMNALGAECILSDGVMTVRGIGHARKTEIAEICCRESGSTLRFLLPLSLALGTGARLTGAPRLAERPLTPYQAICAEQGIVYASDMSHPLSLMVSGKLTAGIYRVPGNISSQFITGLLLALSVLDGDSEIVLTSPLESTAYVDLTLDAMRTFGVTVTVTKNGYRIPGCQTYTAHDTAVEGDYSQAANFLCAAALGNSVEIAGLDPSSLQGDKRCIDILKLMGAEIEYGDGAFRVSAKKLKGAEFDVSNIPDIAPVLALTCGLAEGTSRLTNAGRLRIKECDRFAATIEAINLLGGSAEEDGDTIVVHGVDGYKGGCVCPCRNDHRMAMLYAVASTRCDAPITLDDRLCVKKSYPGFFSDFAKLTN